MSIATKCLSCGHYTDDCTGSESGCGKWSMVDFSKKAQEAPADVDVPQQPTLVTPSQCEGTDGSEESLMDKFDRIGAKRQAQALEAIRKLGHLTSSYHRKRSNVTAYTYEWTRDMALTLLIPIEEALENLKGELLGCDSPREHGLIEEN